MERGRFSFGGFALPSVVLSSVILLMVLGAAMQGLASIRSGIASQYYNQLAFEAAESGAAIAEECLKQGYRWTSPMSTYTEKCSGRGNLSCSGHGSDYAERRCAVASNLDVSTRVVIHPPEVNMGVTRVKVEGIATKFPRGHGGGVRPVAEYKSVIYRSIIQENDQAKTRATQRYWYFGTQAAIDFGVSGDSSRIFRNNTRYTAGEGVTVITDTSGNLKFWTDGRSVFNSSGAVMYNSTGLNGSSSGTQAAASFPLNSGRDGKYIIVTNSADTSSLASARGLGELYYSIVDMSLDGGKGGIQDEAKNTPLWTGKLGYTTEALTVAPKSSGDGYWVITTTKPSLDILVFDFNNDGFSGNPPQRFSTGLNYATYAPGPTNLGFDSMNFNKSYSQLAISSGKNCLNSASCRSPLPSGLARVVDFSADTGKITPKYEWNVSIRPTADSPYSENYGISFSPKENYLYVSTLYRAGLFRYKISGAQSSDDVKNSEEYIANTSTANSGGGQVLAGPDGKMYVANYGMRSVSVINNPDNPTLPGSSTADSIGWIYNGITLPSGTYSRYGLPQMVTVYSPKIISY